MNGKRKSDTSWIYKTDQDSNPPSLFGDLICLLIMIMLVVAVPAGSVKDTGLSIVSGGDCEYVEGTIIDKTTDDGYWDLWVTSNWGDHLITVGEDTYNSVEIGQSYSGQVCSGDGVLWEIVLWLLSNPGDSENITIGDVWTITNS